MRATALAPAMRLHSLRQSYRGFAAVVAQPLRHVARRAILEDVDYDADSINKVQLKGKMLEDLKPYRVDQLTFARGRMQLPSRRDDKCDQIFHVEVIGPAAEVAQASIHAGDYVYVEGGLAMERVSAPAGQQQEVDVPMVIIKAYNLTKGFPQTSRQYQDNNNNYQQQQQASSQINYGVASPVAPSPPPPPAQQQPAAPAYGARNASHGSRQRQMQQVPPAATPQQQQQPAVPRYGSGDGYRRGRMPAAPVAAQQQAPPPTSAPEQAMPQSGGTRSFPDNSYLVNASIEDKWLHVRDNPRAWFDNRTSKTNPKAPDFKLKGKDINVALWVTSKDTPPWAQEMFGAQSAAY